MRNFEVELFLVGVLLGIILTIDYTGPEWHKNIIAKGCGEYNETTGYFQWRDKQ
jgi:hypothetical protein